MTQVQRQWLLDNGYDPAVYDVDDQGNVFENPIAAPATQKKMSAPRAFGTSLPVAFCQRLAVLVRVRPSLGLLQLILSSVYR